VRQVANITSKLTLPCSSAALSGSLSRLYLFGNRLTAAPAVFSSLVQLEQLNLNFNRLESLPTGACVCFRSLLRRVLHGGPVRVRRLFCAPATAGAGSEPQRKHCYCSSRRAAHTIVLAQLLSSLPDTLSSLQRLRTLDISHNRFSEWCADHGARFCDCFLTVFSSSQACGHFRHAKPDLSGMRSFDVAASD
jgi:hypothetical protein